MNEIELIRNLKSGDAEALKILIDVYKDYVYSISYQIVKSVECAEEITQDVFIKVFQKIHAFEGRSKFSTWLFTITYRLSLNQINKKNIMITESDFKGASHEEGGYSDAIFEKLPGDREQFSLGAKPSEEIQVIIWKAIDNLNIQEGLVISLFYLQQFSVLEIAEILQLSENTIKTHLFRGRNNLRAIILKEYAPEDLI
jgi:RNA polymerase sigma-70 factor (ECF subfamily)